MRKASLVSAREALKLAGGQSGKRGGYGETAELMATAVRSKNQVKSEKRAIKKLRELGIIKADLRKAPTRATKAALKKYADVLAGKAVLVRPKNPASYKKIFRVFGKTVIVPRRKGEKITVNKAGEIQGVRKVGKRKVRSTFKHVLVPEKSQPKWKPRVVYALPVQRGGSGTVEWYRWKSWDQMKQDMQQGSLRGYKNWGDYVVEEYLMPGEATGPEEGSDDEDERNSRLDTIMVRRLNSRSTQRRAFVGDQEGY